MTIKRKFDRLRDPDNWLLALEESREAAPRSQRRTWLYAVLGSAAAVAAVVAVPVVLSHQDGQPAAPANPTPSSMEGAVPWKALKAEPSSPASLDSTASMEPCAPNNLHIRIRPGLNPAMGTVYILADVTNSGPVCKFHNSDLKGIHWGSSRHSTASASTPDKAVAILAGSSQEYRLGFSAACISGSSTAVIQAEATIDGQTVPVTSGGIPASLGGCDATNLAPVTHPDDTSEGASPFATLRADMDVAREVSAGTLPFTITLTNTGADPFDLVDQCPSYVQRLTFPGAGPVDEHYQLNCDAAGRLAPGGSVTFAMQIDIPDEAVKAGPIKLTWLMDDAGPDAGELLNASVPQAQ